MNSQLHAPVAFFLDTILIQKPQNRDPLLRLAENMMIMNNNNNDRVEYDVRYEQVSTS